VRFLVALLGALPAVLRALLFPLRESSEVLPAVSNSRTSRLSPPLRCVTAVVVACDLRRRDTLTAAPHHRT
jgi:hypothetical protein